MALGGIGAVIILLVWGIIATLPKKEDGREGEVRLRSEIKDNFTLKDMLGSVSYRRQRKQNSLFFLQTIWAKEPRSWVKF